MLIVGQAPIEIKVGSEIWAVTFSATGEHLVSSDWGVRVWRAEDGEPVASMDTRFLPCLAVSKDVKWIAGGTTMGEVFIWNATSHEKVLMQKEGSPIHAVDFSPDTARLISASENGTAIIWDLVTRKRVHTLCHGSHVIAAKYSPQGDRIAIATHEFVRVWDSNYARPLVEINVIVIPDHNRGLLWSDNRLFVLSDNAIKQFDASTKSIITEWPVVDTNNSSCIALPKHGQFIACSTTRTVTFWDTSTRARLSLIQHPQSIRSIAFSPDDLFLAIGGEDKKITLSRITVSVISRFMSYLGKLDFPHRIRSHCLVYTPLSGNLTFRLTMLYLIYGSMISSNKQKIY